MITPTARVIRVATMQDLAEIAPIMNEIIAMFCAPILGGEKCPAVVKVSWGDRGISTRSRNVTILAPAQYICVDDERAELNYADVEALPTIAQWIDHGLYLDDGAAYVDIIERPGASKYLFAAVAQNRGLVLPEIEVIVRKLALFPHPLSPVTSWTLVCFLWNHWEKYRKSARARNILAYIIAITSLILDIPTRNVITHLDICKETYGGAASRHIDDMMTQAELLCTKCRQVGWRAEIAAIPHQYMNDLAYISVGVGWIIEDFGAMGTTMCDYITHMSKLMAFIVANMDDFAAAKKQMSTHVPVVSFADGSGKFIYSANYISSYVMS